MSKWITVLCDLNCYVDVFRLGDDLTLVRTGIYDGQVDEWLSCNVVKCSWIELSPEIQKRVIELMERGE